MCLSELSVAELKELALGEYVKREAMDVFRKGKNLFFVSSTSLGTRSVIRLLSLVFLPQFDLASPKNLKFSAGGDGKILVSICSFQCAKINRG